MRGKINKNIESKRVEIVEFVFCKELIRKQEKVRVLSTSLAVRKYVPQIANSHSFEINGPDANVAICGFANPIVFAICAFADPIFGVL
jgi:hypothetical protein